MLINLHPESNTKTLTGIQGTVVRETLFTPGPDQSTGKDTGLVAISLSAVQDPSRVINNDAYSNAWFELSWVSGSRGPIPARQNALYVPIQVDALRGTQLIVPASRLTVSALLETSINATQGEIITYNVSAARACGGATNKATFTTLLSVAQGAAFIGAVPAFADELSFASFGIAGPIMTLIFNSAAYPTYSAAFPNALAGLVTTTRLMKGGHRFWRVTNPAPAATAIVQLSFSLTF